MNRTYAKAMRLYARPSRNHDFAKIKSRAVPNFNGNDLIATFPKTKQESFRKTRPSTAYGALCLLMLGFDERQEAAERLMQERTMDAQQDDLQGMPPD